MTRDYLAEFRDPQLARQLLTRIRQQVQPGRQYRLMEFCGGHTHALFRHGIPNLLPPNVRLLHGPGCPVCVLPAGRIDQARHIALQPDTILCSYGDMLRVPGSRGLSLLDARREGADIRMVLSPMDCLDLAKSAPNRRVVFFAVGFETTTPPTALLLLAAREAGQSNLLVHCNHLLTPAAAEAILAAPADGEPTLNGLIGPGHVSLVTGSQAFESISQQHQLPIAITGFEPLDLLCALLSLIRQVNEGTCQTENLYTRAVTREGNRKARAFIDEVMSTRATFTWRGLGELPQSALELRDTFKDWNAERQFDLSRLPPAREHPGCECPAVLMGRKEPQACPLFATACTPKTPLGACMVSSEGACAAQYAYCGKQTA